MTLVEKQGYRYLPTDGKHAETCNDWCGNATDRIEILKHFKELPASVSVTNLTQVRMLKLQL